MNVLEIVKERTIEKSKNVRNINLDLIRDVAIFFVISVHFFLNTDFYYTAMLGKKMYIMSIMRVFFITCVPLFMILSGYLMNKKKPTKDYYKKISKVISIYILASLFCILFKVLYFKMEFTFFSIIKSILNYTACNYAWYIEMYIGLYLLIPFINIMYNGCEGEKQKIILLIVFTFVTIAPSIFNMKWTLIPESWKSLYIITYYLVGAFLSEYKLNISKKWNVIILIVLAIIFGSFNYGVRYGENFSWSAYLDYFGFETFIISILIFNLLLNIDLTKIGKLPTNIMIKISELSLGMYLVSYIFDSIYYKFLNDNNESIIEKFKYFIVIVPAVFISSAVLSQIINWLKSFGEKMTNKILKKC